MLRFLSPPSSHVNGLWCELKNCIPSLFHNQVLSALTESASCEYDFLFLADFSRTWDDQVLGDFWVHFGFWTIIWFYISVTLADWHWACWIYRLQVDSHVHTKWLFKRVTISEKNYPANPGNPCELYWFPKFVGLVTAHLLFYSLWYATS